MTRHRRTKPKSRVRAEKVRITLHTPDGQDQGEPPGYSGHNGGAFAEAGYRSGTGAFGFVQHVVQS